MRPIGSGSEVPITRRIPALSEGVLVDELRASCFPRDDETFDAAVTDAFADLVGDGLSSEDLAEAVASRLRPTYPNVVVQPRDPLARLWPDEAAWYAYRDGSVLASTDGSTEGSTDGSTNGSTPPSAEPATDAAAGTGEAAPTEPADEGSAARADVVA